jgi:dihydroflavonol-4-reductase
MNVLVTGATGFIGSHLCRALLAQGHATRALVRPTSSLSLIEDLALDLVVGDLMDPASLKNAMRDIEIVIHCGAEVGGWRDRESMVASHIIGTENILDAVVHTGVRRMLYTSSVAALGVPDPPPPGEDPLPIDESHQWNYDPDAWPYGHAKHRTEEIVREACRSGLEALILNPAAVIGPGDKNLVASAIVYHMGHGRRPPIPPGGLNVVHVDDVIAGFLSALTRGRSGERYILGGENITFGDFLREISFVIGTRPPRLRPPGWVFSSLAGIMDRTQPIFHLPVRGHMLRMVGRYFFYDLSKAKAELGITPSKTTHQAIQAAHNWYRANPGLIQLPGH